MKKTITKLLAILLVVGLCGCSNPQKDHYKAGIAAMEAGDYAVAIEEFTGAEDYKDAQSKLKEAYYCLGNEYLSNEQYDEAVDAFTLASDYEDAPSKVVEVWYLKGMAAYNEQQYEDAISDFTKSHDFSDTRVRIKECWYKMGTKAFEAKEYDDAVEYFGYAEDYEDAAEKIREVWYTKGKEFLTNQKYDDAREALRNSNGYNDANLRLQLCDLREKLSEASVGDYIKFGTYEQDNKTSNGKEEIEWKVVAKSENKLLVVSRYVLTSKSYDADAGKTWANTKIRTWLNGSFYDGAFTDVEKMSISSTTVKTAETSFKYNDYSTVKLKASAETKDKVFLLTLAQVKKYFPTYNAKPTAYAIAKAGLKSSYDMCFWVTRSSQKAGATELTGLAWVSGDGLTSFIPFGFTDEEIPKIVPNGIRPAMYIRF